MKSTIRHRAAALGIAGVAGLAGIGLAGGPAIAEGAAIADSSSQTASADAGTQSVHYPTDPAVYADELVRAWGNDNTDRVEAFASADVVDKINAHSDDNVTHWDRTRVEGAAGTTYVDYVNTVTGEQMTLGLPTEAVHNGGEWGEPNAVHSIRFEG